MPEISSIAGDSCLTLKVEVRGTQPVEKILEGDHALSLGELSHNGLDLVSGRPGKDLTNTRKGLLPADRHKLVALPDTSVASQTITKEADVRKEGERKEKSRKEGKEKET